MGELLGRQLQPRELAGLFWDAGWRDRNHVTMTAVCLAESQGYDRAYNDNMRLLKELGMGTVARDPESYALYTVVDGKNGYVTDSTGNNVTVSPDLAVVLSRDVGICQINIPAEKIGSDTEAALYDPENNVQAARDLFKRRGFGPWVAYTSGVATNPNWWTWSTRLSKWVPTGRYPHRALRGVGNYMANSLFGIISPSSMLLDYYRVPDKPVASPTQTEIRTLLAYEVKARLPLGERVRLAVAGEAQGP